MSTPEHILEAMADLGPVRDERLSVEQAFRRYHGELINFLRQRLRSEEDAADVAQETYARLV